MVVHQQTLVVGVKVVRLVVHMQMRPDVLMAQRAVVMAVVELEHVVRLVQIMVAVVVVVVRLQLVEVAILKQLVVKIVPVQQDILVKNQQ